MILKKNTAYKNAIIIIGVIILIIIIIFLCFYNKYTAMVPSEIKNSARIYYCDYHTISLKTHISYEKNNDEYDITGNIIRFFTDPLTLSKNGKVIGKADDTYHIINQDDHAIIIDGKFEVDICGNFELLGNSYDLYDQNKNKVGYAEFNAFCTHGAVLNANGDVIAIYSRMPLFNDYKVTIYDNDICSDEAIMMIIGSYVSDYHADEGNNSNNN